MKNKWLTFLMFLSMILTISCAKDYNVLFNERVAELNKEGKYILNQYNDSVGKEHYIVYIDADKIVVDTLGDSLQVYSLGKVETYQYFPNVDFNDGKFSMERYNSTDFTLKADTAKKQIMVSDDTFYPTSNPQPIGFSGILLAKRQNSFYCTYFLHNRNVTDTKSPYPIKRLEVIRWFNQKSMVFNQSLS